MTMKQQRLTENEQRIAARIGARAINAVQHAGATHLDAIITEMQTSGIDPWDKSYYPIGQTALAALLKEVPLSEGRVRKGDGHTSGWIEFATQGQPTSDNGQEDEEDE